MSELLCHELLQYFPSSWDFKDLRSTYIANCVFNNFLTYSAIMLNITTIFGIRRTSSLPKTLRTLLLSLAVSDIGVGLFVQPFYTSLLVKWLQQQNPSCYTYRAFEICGHFFSTASFLGVVAVSVDRFLAIHLHLRYPELVTHKRVVTVVISVWLLSTMVPLLPLLNLHSTQKHILSIAGGICLLLTAVAYTKTYFVALRHRNQIRAFQSQQGEHAQPGEMANFTGLIKTAVGLFYVYLVFLVCYFPLLICRAAVNMNGPGISLKRLYLFSLTLIYLNSTLNPVIYCWKVRHIRHAVMNILRNLFWNRNGASQ